MDEVKLSAVSLETLSEIRHDTLISQSEEFLVLRYRGRYRQGGDGRGDALYIVATATAAREAWTCRSTILDVQELEYVWGDEMEWITSITYDRTLRYHAPLSIIVGVKCRDALKSLLRNEYELFCVETTEQAYSMCREKIQKHKEYLRNWNRK